MLHGIKIVEFLISRGLWILGVKKALQEVEII